MKMINAALLTSMINNNNINNKNIIINNNITRGLREGVARKIGDRMLHC